MPVECIICKRKFVLEILGNEIEPVIPICCECFEKGGQVLKMIIEVPIGLAKMICKYKD